MQLNKTKLKKRKTREDLNRKFLMENKVYLEENLKFPGGGHRCTFKRVLIKYCNQQYNSFKHMTSLN